MRRCALFLMLAALSGCVGHRPEAPSAAVLIPPAGWNEEHSNSVTGPSASWWQAFGDPMLSQVVEEALANNVDVALAAEAVAESRAQFAAARAQLLPSAGFDAGAKRERYLDPFGLAVSDTAEEAEIGISYDLDLFGRLRSASAATRASLLATEAAQADVRLAIAASAAQGYVDLRTLDARLAIVRQTVQARLNSLRIAQRRAQSGYATQLELEQAQAELHATEQLVPALQLAVAHQEDGLSVLLGQNPGAIARGASLAQLSAPPVPALLPSQLLRRRPDIAAAEQRLVAADRSLDSARAAFMPTIGLGANGGFVNSTLIASPVGVFALGSSILAPLYEGGRLQAQADAAAARRNQAAFAYRKTALNAFREVEDALAAVKRTTEQEQVLRQEADDLARALIQATNRYRAGYSSYLEQLDAQRGLLSAQLSLAQAQGDRLNACVRLFQALGGGWSATSL